MVLWRVLRFSNYMLSKNSLSCNDFMIIWPLTVLAHSSWHFLQSLQTVKQLISMKYHCWPFDVFGSLSIPFFPLSSIFFFLMSLTLGSLATGLLLMKGTSQLRGCTGEHPLFWGSEDIIDNMPGLIWFNIKHNNSSWKAVFQGKVIRVLIKAGEERCPGLSFLNYFITVSQHRTPLRLFLCS